MTSLSLPASIEATAPPIDNRELLFGVAGHAWWLDDHLDAFSAAYRDLGVTTVRLSVDWKYIETTPGVYRWDRYDRVLGRLADDGITIVGVFVTVPPWASTDIAGCAVEQTEPTACSLRPEHRPAFDRVVRATLTRYPFVRHWEYWNEPELWTHLGRDVGDYLPFLNSFYTIAKEVDPELKVAAGSLAGWDYVGWLYSLAEVTLGPGVRPWDAIAFHPYNTNSALDADGNELTLRYADIERLRNEMVSKGDGHKPLWITEYGWHFEPPRQAQSLRIALRWMLRQSYIEMAHLHMLHDWEREQFGLMRAVPEVFGVGAITPDTRFEPKEPYYSTFRTFVRPRLPVAPVDMATFASGHRIAPVFLDHWRAIPGAGLGRPVTRAVWQRRAAGDFALVQYFERGRLDWTRREGVSLALLGDEALIARGWLDASGQPIDAATQPGAPASGDQSQYFPETGHTLHEPFLTAWRQAGGVAALGFPRTGVLKLTMGDGSERLVQYVQRGRLELPINDGQPIAVEFGRLGIEAAQRKGWLGADEAPLPLHLNPARPEYRPSEAP